MTLRNIGAAPPRLLVTGGAGFLGHHLIREATRWEVHATYYRTAPPTDLKATFHQCDVCDRAAVSRLIASIRPMVIIHTACSNRSPQDIAGIVPAACHLAEAAREMSCRLLHLSSDMVFDGEHAPYDETQILRPITAYGKAKAEAEGCICSLLPGAVIVRTSLLYGVDPLDHQTRWLAEDLAQGRVVRLFIDEIRSPIWVRTLAKALLELTRIPFAGPLHLAGPEPLTRWELGLNMLEWLGKTPPELLLPSTRSASDTIRPRDLTLNIDKAKEVLSTPLLSIAEVRRRHHPGSPGANKVRPRLDKTS